MALARRLLKVLIVVGILFFILLGTYYFGFGGGILLGMVGILVLSPLGVVWLSLETIYQVRKDRTDLEEAKARVAAEEAEMEAYILSQMAGRGSGIGGVKEEISVEVGMPMETAVSEPVEAAVSKPVEAAVSEPVEAAVSKPVEAWKNPSETSEEEEF